MSSGAIAAVVNMVLLACIATIGLVFLWKTRQDDVRRFLRLGSKEMNETSRNGGSRARNTGFENLAYSSNNQGEASA